MKKQKLFHRLFISIMISAILLPPISCLIFYQAAKKYAEYDAARNLQAVQEEIIPLINSYFRPEEAAPDTSHNASQSKGNLSPRKIKGFLRQISSLMHRLDGNAQLIILESEMKMIYPREEDAREFVTPLANDFIEYMSHSASQDEESMATIQAGNGEAYLVNFYRVPPGSPMVQYLIVYCRTSQIGTWVRQASFFVYAISTALALILFTILWNTAKRTLSPIRLLCKKAEQIGNGDYDNIATVFSIIELEELRLSMNRMSDKLLHAEEVQKNFFQNVSHELRNPLMSISGYAQGIEQGFLPDAKAAAHTIMTESTRLSELVGKLLTLSRLDSDVKIPSMSSAWLIDSISECFDRLSGLALSKGISLTLEPFDHHLTVYGDDELISTVLENLLTNALRYAKSAVSVSVRDIEGKVSVSVLDDGNGISELDLPHIFERCYKGNGGNFGIGLSIASSAAKKMKGSLTAANSDSGGALFTLTLQKM